MRPHQERVYDPNLDAGTMRSCPTATARAGGTSSAATPRRPALHFTEFEQPVGTFLLHRDWLIRTLARGNVNLVLCGHSAPTPNDSIDANYSVPYLAIRRRGY